MLKHETLLKRGKSKSHTYSRECYLNCKARPCGALPQVLAQSRTAQQAEIQRGLEIKFNLAYTIAKEEFYQVPSISPSHKEERGADQPRIR